MELLQKREVEEMIQITHNELLEFAQILGYAVNEEGECFGFTHVAILDTLMNNLDRYIHSLQKIKKLLSDYKKAALEARECGHEDEDAEKIAKASLNLKMQTPIKTLIHAFLDTVLILSRPWRHHYLYPEGEAPKGQTFKTTYRYVRPVPFKTKAVRDVRHSNIWHKKLFCGYYRYSDLSRFLEGLRGKLSSHEFSTPVCFRLTNNEHTLLITYNSSNDKWMMIDSGTPVEYDGNESRLLAGAIFKAFMTPLGVALATVVYARKSDAKLIQKKIGRLPALWNSQQATLAKRLQTSLLAVASRNGYIDVVKHALLQAENKKKLIADSRAVEVASEYGELEVIQALSSAATVCISEDGGNALWWASRNGHSDVVAFLLEQRFGKQLVGVALAYVNEAFIYACKFGRVNVVEVFVNSGYLLDYLGDNGTTGLIEAASRNYVLIVKMLLRNGASIDSEARNNETALHRATDYGHFQTVSLLLSHGANVRNKIMMGRPH